MLVLRIVLARAIRTALGTARRGLDEQKANVTRGTH